MKGKQLLILLQIQLCLFHDYSFLFLFSFSYSFLFVWNSEGAIVHLVKPVPSGISVGALLYNEFIVYSLDQVRVKYLVQLVCIITPLAIIFFPILFFVACYFFHRDSISKNKLFDHIPDTSLCDSFEILLEASKHHDNLSFHYNYLRFPLFE